MSRWKPKRLRIRSGWMGDTLVDTEIPSKDKKEIWEAERHWGLILFRFKWGHTAYKLIVNKDDELELVNLGKNNGDYW